MCVYTYIYIHTHTNIYTFCHEAMCRIPAMCARWRYKDAVQRASRSSSVSRQLRACFILFYFE